MRKVLSMLSLIAFCIILHSCGEKCLPNKNNGDIVIVTKQTFGACDRSAYNKMMDAAINKNNSATVEMVLAGQLRIVMPQTRGTIKDKDGTRALILLPDDNREWWINADFLE